ncbi:pth [Symbiodinium necroappetens]|uniref:Pth protein n=1 Tax=Symbiodinium necroappetens TaxID=1628268 RepID=A0A812LC49_9DINO|nr:pth [Symbiodinium necroappetens]
MRVPAAVYVNKQAHFADPAFAEWDLFESWMEGKIWRDEFDFVKLLTPGGWPQTAKDAPPPVVSPQPEVEEEVERYFLRWVLHCWQPLQDLFVDKNAEQVGSKQPSGSGERKSRSVAAEDFTRFLQGLRFKADARTLVRLIFQRCEVEDQHRLREGVESITLSQLQSFRQKAEANLLKCFCEALRKTRGTVLRAWRLDLDVRDCQLSQRSTCVGTWTCLPALRQICNRCEVSSISFQPDVPCESLFATLIPSAAACDAMRGCAAPAARAAWRLGRCGALLSLPQGGFIAQARGLSAQDFEALSIRELQDLARQRGVDPEDCFEKRDLVEKLRKVASGKTTFSTCQADPSTGEVADEEVASMSITELRALIHEAGLGSRDLLERNDFLQRAKEAQKILRTKAKTEESTSRKASSSKAATGSSTKGQLPWDVRRYQELEIVLFARGGCPHCVAAFELLKRRGLPNFDLQDVEWSKEAVQEFRRLGGNGVPFFYSKRTGKSLSGWKPDATDLEWLVQRHGVVQRSDLERVCRVVGCGDDAASVWQALRPSGGPQHPLEICDLAPAEAANLYAFTEEVFKLLGYHLNRAWGLLSNGSSAAAEVKSINSEQFQQAYSRLGLTGDAGLIYRGLVSFNKDGSEGKLWKEELDYAWFLTIKLARHNLGSLVVEALAADLDLKWEWWWSCFGWIAHAGAGELAGLKLLIPGTFYNLSGWGVRRACTVLGLESRQLILLHDDIDLECFCWAIRSGGSDGGNRGVRSVFQALDPGVKRLRIGVGRPPSRDPTAVAGHVLAAVDPELLQRWRTAARTGELLEILGLGPGGSSQGGPPGRGCHHPDSASASSATWLGGLWESTCRAAADRIRLLWRSAANGKLCPIEVPKVVLTADDCDPSLLVLEPCSWDEAVTLPSAKRRFSFQLPSTSEPGCFLTFRLPEGEKVSVQMPEGLQGGETAMATQRPDGKWRLTRKPTHFTFAVPPGAKPGQVLKPQLPDGTFLHLELPENVQPGHLVELKNLEGTWAVVRIVELLQVARNPPQTETLRGSYLAALEHLRQSGGLRALQADTDGMLVVNVPFCGRFQEYAMLGNFLAEHCLTLPGVKGIRIFATDSQDKYHYDWAVAKRWFAEFHPQIEVQLSVRDLHIDSLPRAALTVATHPEVTRGGTWFPIIGSIVRAAAKGTCLFGTFFEDEATTLTNMVNMYKTNDQTSCEVSENQYFMTPESKETFLLAPVLAMLFVAFYSREADGFEAQSFRDAAHCRHGFAVQRVEFGRAKSAGAGRRQQDFECPSFQFVSTIDF